MPSAMDYGPSTTQMPSTILSFGEVLWDAFGDGKRAGGAPMNVALNLAKQGANVVFASRIGTDALGVELLDYLKQNGLYSNLIQQDDVLPTCEVTVQLDEHQQATYVIPQPVSWDNIQTTDALTQAAKNAAAIVFGSLACRTDVTRDTLLNLLEYTTVLKVFDVNLRAPHYTLDVIELLASKADFIKMNEDEAELLVPEGDNLAEKITRFSNKYPAQTICVTRGAHGAIVWHKSAFYEHPGFPVEVVDTVGAGDSFLATFINGLTNNQPIPEILEKACAVGAYVAGKRGANPEYDEGIRKVLKSGVGPSDKPFDRLIAIEFQNERQDQIDFFKYQFFERLRKNPAVVAIISVFVAYFLADKTLQWWQLVYLLAVPALLTAAYFLFLAMQTTNVKSSKSSSINTDPKILEIGNQYLKITNKATQNTTVIHWKDIASVHSSKKWVYFFISSKRPPTDKKAILIPKRYLPGQQENDLLQIFRKRFNLPEKWFEDKFTQQAAKSLYWMGFLCLLPVVGGFAGLALAANGLFKYRDKLLVLMGVAGIVFSIVLLDGLNMLKSDESNRGLFTPLSQEQLNALMRDIEFYKTQHGVYPDSLGGLKKDYSDISIDDPMQNWDKKTNTEYYYKRVGNRYYLFSLGVDGVANTKDDIYPNVSKMDTTKIGLILKP